MPSHLPLHPRLLLATRKPYAPGIGLSGWLKLAALPDGKSDVLMEHFVLVQGHITITIPAGFVTDGASCPWPLCYLTHRPGPWRIAGTVHDWLYYCHRFKDRRQADLLLADIAIALHASIITTTLVWAAVRLFGGFAWRRYRTFDAANKILHPHLDTQEF